MSQLKIKEKKNHFAFLGNFITILILVVAIGVCAYAGGNLYKIFSEYKAGTDEYAKISDMVVTEKKADVKDETWVDKETKKKVWTAPIEVDCKKLAQINPDFVGWLYVEALPDISYPMVHYKDNDFYLHRTFEKQDNFAGTIFTDCQNKRNLGDSNGIKYIPGTAADVLDIIDQCSFRYEPEDWTVGRSAEEEIKTGIARLKAGGCTWTSLYNTRLEAEIEMLRKTDTEGYFLTVCDILRLAEEYYPSDPFYPGLLVSYVLGITDIDPVCNDILTKLSEETFVAGIHHPRFMIRSELSDSLYKKIREKYAVSRISKDTIVIGYPDIRDYVPVCRDRIQCDRDEAEKMGLFCMDLEEQEYLSIFKECISSIQDPGIPIDSEVFKNVIAKGHLNFICGCEGMEIQKQIRQSHPESIRELVSFFSSTCEKAEAFYRALFVYRSAYLKYRFPLNYISAYISHFPDKMRSIKYDAVCKDLVFLDPDINVSEADCFVERDSIRLGLKSTGVSGKTVENILQERREGFFLSADDLMNRVKLSDREAECLNDAGVFQNIGGPVSDRSVPVVEEPPEEPDKDLIPMEGVVLKTEEKISKDGSMIASVRMGTSSGEVYAMFFAKAYEKYAGLLKADAELRLYGEYVQDRYGNTFSVKEAYPVSDDVYYISAKVYEEAVFYPFRRRCGCQLFLMEPSGRLVNTGCFYSSRIADIQGVRMIPKI